MEETTLHGVKYIAEDGRHWSERVLWTLLVILGYENVSNLFSYIYLFSPSFITTFVFIWPIWRKYLDSPTLTTIGSTNYPIWEVSFFAYGWVLSKAPSLLDF